MTKIKAKAYANTQKITNNHYITCTTNYNSKMPLMQTDSYSESCLRLNNQHNDV